MRSFRHRAFVAAAMSCLVVVAACGDDDDSSDADTTAAVTAPATAAATGSTAASAASTSSVTADTAAPSSGDTAAPATAVDTTESTDGEPVEMTSISIAVVPSFPSLPQYVAIAEGFLADHGLEVEPVQVSAGPEMGAAMISGDIIFAGAIPNNQITLIEAGFDVVAVAQQVGSQFFDIAVASDFDLGGATEWQDVMKALEGANIGVVANGAAAEDIARTLFKEAGVDPDAQTYIATGLPDTTLASLLNEQVDAAVNFDPLFVLAEQEGAGTQPFSLRAGEGPESLLWPSLLVTTSREYAEENPEIVREYVAALSEAIDMIQDPAQRDRVIEIMTTDMGLPATIAEGMLDAGGDSFTAGMELDTASLDRAGAWVFEIGKSSKAYTAADFTLPIK
jgi:NitT/TauT family transport system substrate-binding protein